MTRRARRFIVTVLVVGVIGCGSAASAQDQTVDVQDNSFVPPTITITPGGAVTWSQSGSNPHSVTADDGSFDSHPNCPPACMSQGGDFSHTFEDPGEFGYYCKIHGSPGQGMSGTVVVQAAGGDPQDETDPPADEPVEDPADDPAQDDRQAGEAADASGARPEQQARADTDDTDQALPRTGSVPAVTVVGLGLFAAGLVAFRRRGRTPH